MADPEGTGLTSFDADRLRMALPVDHALARRERRALSNLADGPFVLWPQAEGRGAHLRIVRLCADASLAPRVVKEAHGMHAVLSSVAIGAGVALVADQAERGWRRPAGT